MKLALIGAIALTFWHWWMADTTWTARAAAGRRPGSMQHWLVHRLMHVLEEIATAEEGLSTPEVAARLECTPRTARRIMHQLVEDRYLEAVDGHRKRWIVSNRGRRLGMLLAASWAPDRPIDPAWVPRLHDLAAERRAEHRERALRLIRDRPGITSYALEKSLRVSLGNVYRVLEPLLRDKVIYSDQGGYYAFR